MTNIETLVNNMILYGIDEKEQIRFMNSLALAVSGDDLSVAKMHNLTGLPRRALEQGKIMRKQFEDEVIIAKDEKKAQDEAVVPDEGQSDNDHDIEVGDNSDHDIAVEKYSHSEPEVENNHDDANIIPGKRGSANRGEGTRRKENRFRIHFTCKARDVRIDNIDSDTIQNFLHYSPWGGRVDTSKLFRHQVLIEQPLGGLQYECVRSYQYSVTEMYGHFKNSEYGTRQRLKNKGKNSSLKRFRELICPYMTKCKQRDTADEIVAEFKHCLATWNINMRIKDRNVRASIERCQATDCPQHKLGSDSANLYSCASKSLSQFLAYLLCPQIQRDELAVKVMNGPSTYSADMAAKKAINIALAVRAKSAKKIDYLASGARKCKQ